MSKPRKNQCPRCGGGIPNNDHMGAYPGALSRWDNRTEVCSACGTDEALTQMAAVHENPWVAAVSVKQSVDPVQGAKPWMFVPAGLRP